MTVIKMQSRPSLKDRMKRAANPSFLSPAAPNPPGSPFDYRVSKNDDTGNVVVSLGSLAPFEIPPESAAKLAMLLLKYAGNDAAINASIMVLRSAGIIATGDQDGQE